MLIQLGYEHQFDILEVFCMVKFNYVEIFLFFLVGSEVG